MIIIGIDPGFKSSATGVTVFDTSFIMKVRNCTGGILKTERERIRYISRTVGYELDLCLYEKRQEYIVACIESFVMRGKGGQTLQRLIGALVSNLPDYVNEVRHVQNTVVKKHLGGHGHATKEQVAQGVLKWFKPDPRDKNYESWLAHDDVEKWIEQKEWDILDSLAIGIAGAYAENR